MTAHWPDAVDVLRRYGAVTDAGQISPRDRRRLARLAVRGVVAKDVSFAFPIPKTRWLWVEG